MSIPSHQDVFCLTTAVDRKVHLEKLLSMYACAPDENEKARATVGTRFFGYSKAKELWTQKVTKGECVALIQEHVEGIGHSSLWKQGPRVQDTKGSIPEGTVIATFWNKVYPSKKTGNHAAFYISHDGDGILVAEQSNTVSPYKFRYEVRGQGTGKIRFKGVNIPKDQSGEPPAMTNAAEYYYVVLDNRPV